MKMNANNEPDNMKDPAQPKENDRKQAFVEQIRSGKILRSNKFWLVVIAILFLAFISANSNASGSKSKLNAQIRRLTTETDALNTAIDEYTRELEEQKRMEDAALTQEEEELARNDAKVQGAEVARLQNVYLSIDEKYIPQLDAALGDDEQSRSIISDMNAEITANKNSLDPCFDDKGKRDGKGKWYNYNTNGIAGSWEFATNASFRGDTTEALWLCYSKDDHTLLAYATSKYNANTKLFGEVSIQLTSYAESHVKSDPDPSQASDQSLIDQMKGLVDDGTIQPNTPPADQPFGQDTIDNNNDMQDARDAYKDAVKNGEVDGEGYDENYNIGLGGQEPSL